jgi:hypothetical protein
MLPSRLVDTLAALIGAFRSTPATQSPTQYPTPGWQYDPPPRLATYMHRGGRIGLAVATGLGALLIVYLTLIGMLGELFLAELVPGLDLVIDCLTLVGSIVVAVVCYYAGILGGMLVYAIAYARWRSRETGVRATDQIS